MPSGSNTAIQKVRHRPARLAGNMVDSKDIRDSSWNREALVDDRDTDSRRRDDNGTNIGRLDESRMNHGLGDNR